MEIQNKMIKLVIYYFITCRPTCTLNVRVTYVLIAKIFNLYGCRKFVCATSVMMLKRNVNGGLSASIMDVVVHRMPILTYIKLCIDKDIFMIEV